MSLKTAIIVVFSIVTVVVASVHVVSFRRTMAREAAKSAHFLIERALEKAVGEK
jgi:hypothetical protein